MYKYKILIINMYINYIYANEINISFRLTVEKKLWLRFLDTLRLSVSPPDDASTSPLPPLLGLFLARASQVLSQPEHPLYAPLHRFVLARPALDTAAVPDLLRLLHSAEPENR